MNARANLEPVRHVAQDLRAEAHKVPEDVARLMRQAALVCDDYVALRAAVGELAEADAPRPCPIPPPSQEQAQCV